MMWVHMRCNISRAKDTLVTYLHAMVQIALCTAGVKITRIEDSVQNSIPL